MGESVEPAELALVNMCRQVDPYYTNTNIISADTDQEEGVEHNVDHNIKMSNVDYIED